MSVLSRYHKCNINTVRAPPIAVQVSYDFNAFLIICGRAVMFSSCRLSPSMRPFVSTTLYKPPGGNFTKIYNVGTSGDKDEVVGF